MSASNASTVGGYTYSQISASARAQRGNIVSFKGGGGPYLPGNSSITYVVLDMYTHRRHGRGDHDASFSDYDVYNQSGGTKLPRYTHGFSTCGFTTHAVIYFPR